MAGVLADITVQSDLLVCAKSIGATASGLVMAAAVPSQQSKEKKAVEDRLQSVRQNVAEFERLLKEHVSSASAGVAAVLKARAALEEADVERARLGPYASLHGTDLDVSFLVQDMEQVLDCLGPADIKDGALRKEVVGAAQALLGDVNALLELLVVQRKDADKYQDALVALNEALGKKVERVLVAARRIPGAGELELVESSLEDLASQEMLNAAAQIRRFLCV